MRPPLPRLLTPLLMLALAALLAGVLAPHAPALPRAAQLHLVFTLGILPLMLAAMAWFTPVLTRSGGVEPWLALAPLLALAAGALLLYALLHSFTLYLPAAALALTAVALLSYWIARRSRQTLGAPHPGLLWYRLALLLLAGGLLAVAAGTLWPDQWPALRRLHLHLNLLGFIGLTALGTLRVLLPTVAGIDDPQATPWLRDSWRWLLTGALLIATGAAWWPPLSLAGALLWLAPLGRLLAAPLYSRRAHFLRWHGAAPTLGCAILGLTLSLAGGLGHALGLLPAAGSPQAFILGFLLPLVSGAATHLLPLWRHPSAPDRQRQTRRQLGRFGALRGLLFLLAGSLALAGLPFAWLPALLGLLPFLWRALRLVAGA